MTFTKPLLLIDVDGVLNCLGSWDAEYERKQFLPITRNLHDQTIRVRHETRDYLCRLVEAFTPVWCTGWKEHAHPHFDSVLGLGPRWPHIEFPGLENWDPAQSNGEFWKRQWVDDYVGSRRFAWIDDELTEADIQWGANRKPPALLIKTNPERGLTEDHVVELLAWA